jgi:phosphopantothenoylcysteine decarboxylase/phosphopantothenate--cysteine ligase
LVNPLRNKKVLITAGPTREYWDPVRFLSNASSGAMGIALAEEAQRLGARVTLILGPTDLRPGKNVRVVSVISGWDMYQAVKKNLSGTDVFVGAAAVVDYRPAEPLKLKVKRKKESVALKLFGNPDIIAMVGHHKKQRPGSVIGFALETDHMLENAHAKMLRKRMDWILANRESNMGKTSGSGMLLSRWGHRVPLAPMTKDKLAKKIWQTVLN